MDLVGDLVPALGLTQRLNGVVAVVGALVEVQHARLGAVLPNRHGVRGEDGAEVWKNGSFKNRTGST